MAYLKSYIKPLCRFRVRLGSDMGALFTLALACAKVKALTLAVPKAHYGLERL